MAATFTLSPRYIELREIVTSAVLFAPTWWAWWCSLQPRWRLPDNLDLSARSPPKLNRNLLSVDSMNGLRLGGLRGFFVALLGLGLWASAREHSTQSTKGLTAAIGDVKWVLSSFVEKESLSAGMRVAEIDEGRRSKK